MIINIIYEYHHHCLEIGQLNIVSSVEGNLLGIGDDPAQ